MSQIQSEFKKSFFRKVILPVITVFMIPAVSWWFYDYTIKREDQSSVDQVLKSIDNAANISDDRKKEFKDYIVQNRPNEACWSKREETSTAKDIFKEVCTENEIFTYLKYTGMALVYFGIGSLAIVALLAWMSFKNQIWQYWTFFSSYQLAKIFCFLQVIGQGILSVSLVYYVMVIFAHRISPKLILVVGILAFTGIVAILKILFMKIDTTFELDDRLTHILNQDDHRSFFDKIKNICQQVNTSPPNNIILGIDDNFYVTESPIKKGGLEISGRSLYLSLYHLKYLEQSEANAIFAHEMAHFSGGDTYFSQKTSPLLHKVELLLETLSANAITIPVFYFMNLYVHLFHLSMSDLKRQREFRADKIASQVTSPSDMAKSLIKVIGFSDFRSQFEKKLFGTKENITNDKLFDSLRKSFAENITADTGKDIFNHSVTHPFDSHPSFVDRMKALNIQINEADIPDILKSNVQANWYDEIANAESIETKLMEEYERRFKADHEINLAYTYLPANDHEKMIVERYFPELNYSGSGDHRLKITYEGVYYSGWNDPVLFSNLQTVTHKNETFMDRVFLEQSNSIPKKQRVQAIKINKFSKQKADIISKISLYYQRSYYAKSHQKSVEAKE